MKVNEDEFITLVYFSREIWQGGENVDITHQGKPKLVNSLSIGDEHMRQWTIEEQTTGKW